MLRIAVTGHRNLINSEEVRSKIALGLNYFKEIDEHVFIVSALAAGADTIFAEEALKARIPLEVILPFPIEEYKKDFSSKELINLKKIIAEVHSDVKVVQIEIPRTQQDRDEGYLRAGKDIVDSCDIVFAVWDGEIARGKGGTGDIVEYARSSNKQVHIISVTRDENAVPQTNVKLFHDLDRQAIFQKKMVFELIWKWGISLGLAAVVAFAFIVSFLQTINDSTAQLKIAVATLEVIFVLASAILLGIFANPAKVKFLILRRNAEYLRHLIWFSEAGIPISNVAGEIDQERLLPEILAIEKNLSTMVNQSPDFENAKRLVWSLAFEQKQYQDDVRKSVFETNEKFFHKLFNVMKTLFFAAVAIKYVIELLEFNHIHFTNINLDDFLQICIFIVIVLPPAYASLEGYRYFSDWKQNSKISALTSKELSNCLNRIQESVSIDTLVREAGHLRSVLNPENSDWAESLEGKEIEAKP